MRSKVAVATVLASLTLLGTAEASHAPFKDCWIQGANEGLADLSIKHMRCVPARAIYGKSLRVALDNLEAGREDNPTTFRYRGRRWTCRARNPHREIKGVYVYYVWTCTAPAERVVRYRWLAGD